MNKKTEKNSNIKKDFKENLQSESKKNAKINISKSIDEKDKMIADLKVKLKEITTYYRVYDVKLLKMLPFNELKASGYSLGVKIVWFMKILGADLIETPIHFKDRKARCNSLYSL